MKRFLLSLTLALAGILCLGGVAQATTFEWRITGHQLYPEKADRLRDLNNRLRSAEATVARARHEAQHARNAGDRARAAEYVAQHQRVQAEAAELQRFLEAVRQTTLVMPHEVLSGQPYDAFMRWLRDNPNRRGQIYTYNSRTNSTGVPTDANAPSPPSPRPPSVQPSPRPAPAPAPTPTPNRRTPGRPNNDSLPRGSLGTGN